MLSDEEIAAMKDPSQGNSWADDARALKRLLAERELLVSEHRLVGAGTAVGTSQAVSDAWRAVEAFK